MNTAIEHRDLPATLLLDASVIDDPYAFYRRLVAEAPVWPVPGTEIVIVSSFDAVSEVVGRVDDFSSNLRSLLYRNALGTPELFPFDPDLQALATADPPVHAAHRGTVFPELVARRMTALRPDIEALAEDLLAKALSKPRFEVMNDIANAIPIRVVSQLIAFQGADPAQLLTAAFDTTAMLAATKPLEEIQTAMERSVEVITWIADQLQQSVDRGGGDGILGVIGAAVAAGELDFSIGFAILQTLLSAGGESTTSLLGNAIHMLALNPELQTRLRNEPELVAPFIEEALRLESPFRYHLRHTTRETELRGVPIAAGSTLLLFWGAANRDPAEYDRPDEVVLDRQVPRHHLAFGRGIHFCVGAPLARLEAQIVLTQLLAATEHFALDSDRPSTRVDSLMVRRFDTLPLVAKSSR